MPSLDIRIHRQGDPPIRDLDALADETALIAAAEDREVKVVLIEGGMASGLPSVALFVPVRLPALGDGLYVVAENSLANLTMVLAAARGAFPEAFEGGPFQVGLQERIERALEILTEDPGTESHIAARLRMGVVAQILRGEPSDG